MSDEYNLRDRLEDVQLLLTHMHHYKYEIHTTYEGTKCKCSICTDIKSIINGVRPAVLAILESDGEKEPDPNGAITTLLKEQAEATHQELCHPDSHARLCYEAWERVETAEAHLP